MRQTREGNSSQLRCVPLTTSCELKVLFIAVGMEQECPQ